MYIVPPILTRLFKRVFNPKAPGGEIESWSNYSCWWRNSVGCQWLTLVLPLQFGPCNFEKVWWFINNKKRGKHLMNLSFDYAWHWSHNETYKNKKLWKLFYLLGDHNGSCSHVVGNVENKFHSFHNRSTSIPNSIMDLNLDFHRMSMSRWAESPCPHRALPAPVPGNREGAHPPRTDAHTHDVLSKLSFCCLFLDFGSPPPRLTPTPTTPPEFWAAWFSSNLGYFIA